MSSLVELQKELEGKRAIAAGMFRAKHYTEFTADEAAEVTRLNDECNGLADKIKGFKSLEGIKNGLAAFEQPVITAPFPTEGGEGKEAGEGQYAVKSMGQMFVESQGLKGYVKAAKAGPEVVFGFKDIFATTALAGQATSPGFQPLTYRNGVMVDIPVRTPKMNIVLPPGRMGESNSVTFSKETVLVNGAVFVGEGEYNKAEASLKIEEDFAPVRKVRVALPVTDEMLQDAPQLQTYINKRLLGMLANKIDQALLTGNGTAPNIKGILTYTDILTQARGTDFIPDAFHKAMTKINVTNEGYAVPSHIVMNPNDWEKVRLAKTNDGAYLYGSPLEVGPQRMWGLDVIDTTAMSAGTGLVGDFETCAQQYIRSDVSMLISTENEDNFYKGLVTIKAEARIALVIYRPSGICQVTGL